MTNAELLAACERVRDCVTGSTLCRQDAFDIGDIRIALKERLEREAEAKHPDTGRLDWVAERFASVRSASGDIYWFSPIDGKQIGRGKTLRDAIDAVERKP